MNKEPTCWSRQHRQAHTCGCTSPAARGGLARDLVMIQNLGFRIGILRCSKWLGIGWWDGDVPDGGGQVCDD